MIHSASIPARLGIFADWWKDDDGWYTVAQLAEIIECAEGSIPCAFTWLRRNGFVVSVRRVWTRRANLYNIRRCKAWALERQTDRSQVALATTRQKLARKLVQV